MVIPLRGSPMRLRGSALLIRVRLSRVPTGLVLRCPLLLTRRFTREESGCPDAHSASVGHVLGCEKVKESPVVGHAMANG